MTASADQPALVPLQNPYSGEGCFFCGTDNPIGLQLKFCLDPGPPAELVCRWLARPAYRGLGKVLHGGIQSGMFDEIMGWTAHRLLGQAAVTTSLQISFHKPVTVEQELEVRCRLAGQEGPVVHLAAELRDASGRVCAAATGTYHQMSYERFRALMGESD